MIRFVKTHFPNFFWWAQSFYYVVPDIIDHIRRRRNPYYDIPVNEKVPFVMIDLPTGQVEMWWFCGAHDYGRNSTEMSTKLRNVERYMEDIGTNTNEYHINGSAWEDFSYARVVVKDRKTALLIKLAT